MKITIYREKTGLPAPLDNQTSPITNFMDKRIQRLKDIATELHDIANSYAGDKTGTAAASLHGVGGRVLNGVRMLETGITLEDKKQVLREHFKAQTYNQGKSEAEIEELVEIFADIG